jgi:hypothetical protein
MDNEKNDPEPQKNNKLKIIALCIGLALIVFSGWFYLGLKTTQAPDQKINLPADRIEVTLKINTGEKSYQFPESIKKDASVLDLLNEASAKEGFALDVKDSSLGAFIDGIYGIKNDSAANKFWILWVNSKSANVGASQFKLSDGDVVEWVYGNI